MSQASTEMEAMRRKMVEAVDKLRAAPSDEEQGAR